MSEFTAPRAHAEFQYADAAHQQRTALAGMWLFLATEVLFFGALFYLWLLLRRWHPEGFHKAAGDTDLSQLGIDFRLCEHGTVRAAALWP